MLIEQHKVEVALLTEIDGISTVADGHHLVAFLFKEEDMGPQLFNLVVYPQ